MNSAALNRRLCFYLSLLLVCAVHADTAEQEWVLLRGEPALEARVLNREEGGWRIQAVEEEEARILPDEAFVGWMRVRPAPPRPPANARVFFQNGDWLDGEFLKVDGDALHLRTDAETERVFRVDQIASVEFPPPPESMVLAGTKTVDGWLHPRRVSEDVEVKALPTAGGLLVNQPVPGIIRLPLPPLPDNMLLELSLLLPRPDTPYSLYLFSSERTVYNSGTVHIRHQDGRLQIQQRTYQNSPVEFEAVLPDPVGHRHHLQLFVNHESKRLQLWLNGKLLQEAALVLRENPDEGGLWFSVAVEPGQHYFLEHLRVFSRTGAFPVERPLDPPGEGLWRLTLANGDHLDVPAGRSDGEFVTVALKDGPAMNLPLRVVRGLRFPGRTPEARDSGVVRVRLASGLGQLSGEVGSLKDGVLTLRHPAARDALELPLHAVDGLWKSGEGGSTPPPFPVRMTNDE